MAGFTPTYDRKTLIIKLCFYSFISILIVVIVRTLNRPSEHDIQACKPHDTDFIRANAKVLNRFQTAIQAETVSYTQVPYKINETALELLVKHIRGTFPYIHASPLVKVETISNYSLLYTVKGSDGSLQPFMLCAHLDVVPATHDEWDVPPFSASVHDGYIYGRGTLDDKQALMSMLEATEFALSRGHEPRRGFYLAFGHDEEIRGVKGAKEIARVLRNRDVKLDFLIDEGLTIISGVIPGVHQPVALIGTSEKGFLTLSLSVNVTGGHSSMPGKESSIGILANAVSRLEASPQPSMFGYGPESVMLESLTGKMTVPFRVVMSNLWLFGPIVSWIMSLKPTSNAILRTTTAVTEFHAGIKMNVLAPTARATVNHRVHPAQSLEEVIEHDRKVVNDDRVKVEVMNSMEPMKMSPHGDDVFGYTVLKTSIRQVFPSVAVAPGLMIANTDTIHYIDFTEKIYRFNPSLMEHRDVERIHGVNERISVNNYEQTINFWYHILMNADRTDLMQHNIHENEL